MLSPDIFVLIAVVRVILIGELFPRNFHVVFAQFFNLPDFPDFFSRYVKVNESVFLASGEFHEY